MGMLKEAHRRNVFRVALAYVVTSWLLLQIADIVFDGIGAPGWVMRGFMALLALGFLPSIFFAWAFEVTPEGIKPEREVDRTQSITDVTGHRLDIVIIVMLLVIGGFVLWERQFRELPTDTAVTPSAVDAAAAGEGASELTTDKSIAVLPFVNLSSDPEQEYFSDGISEELLNVLAQIPALRVAARTSSFQFKGDNRDIGEIARQLKVNHVLEGSVRKAGTRLRITAQLIEAENGYHLWSQTYDRELKDVFAIQDEISAAIGSALVAELELQGEADRRPAPRVAETANTAAYEAYLKGRYLVNQRGNRAITDAVRELEKAIRLDPDYAPARAQLAIAITLLNNSPSSYGDLTVAQVNARATPHIEAAMASNPNLPEVWGARAILAATNDDEEAALEFATRAVELNPVYIDALNWMNTAALQLGRYREAEQSIERLMEADPLSVIGQLNYATNFVAGEDPAQARAVATRLTRQHKWAGYVAQSNISSVLGEMADSLEWMLLAYAEDPLDRFSNEAMAATFALVGLYEEGLRVSDATRFGAQMTAGRFADAVAELREDLRLDPDNSYLKGSLATSLYFLGDADAATELFAQLMAEFDGRALIGGGYAMTPTLRYAWLLRQAGQEQRAREILALVDRDIEAKKGTSFERGSGQYIDRAQRAWFDRDREKTLDWLRQAVALGGRPLRLFDDPMFASLRDDAEFIALRDQVDAYLAAEKEKALVLVCRRNPIPQHWQPLAETCSSKNSSDE